MKCPECGKQLKEQTQFPGLWTCENPECDGMLLTPVGSGNFEIALETVEKEKDMTHFSE